MVDAQIAVSEQALTKDEPMVRSEARCLKITGIAAAIAVPAIFLLVPAPTGLAPEGKRLAALLFVALILWATEAIPIAVTALLVIVLQPLFRVEDLRTAFNNFITPAFFLVIAMFCVAQAMVSSGLAHRFALWLLTRTGTDNRRVVLAFMIGAAAISTVVADIPACSIFMAVALGMLSKAGLTPGSSRLGKAIMMGIPIASLIGGVGTPAGSPINIIGIYFIEQYGKVRVPFLSWMAIGMPMVIVLTPVAWWVVVRYCRPERDPVMAVADAKTEWASLGPKTPSERKVLALLSLMFILWVLSTWITQLDVTLVAMCGAVTMFLPGINLLKWDETQRNIGWDSLLMIGSVTSLGAASVKTGLAKWLVESCLGGMQDWNTLSVVALIAAFTVAVHLVLPIAPVVNAVLIPPIALLAISMGKSPALYALPVAFTASCAFLPPLDAVPLVTYSKGYYRMVDLIVPGTIISVCWVVLMTLLMVFLAPAVGAVQ
jgi:solute carrier family 13 (sodium-dependent dicarboxylate transporter), member 2/3/5